MDLRNAYRIDEFLDPNNMDSDFLKDSYKEALNYINGFSWHDGINDVYL